MTRDQAIGRRTRERREALGLSQRDLATLAQVGHIHEIELGYRDPGPIVLARLADALGCTVEDLTGSPEALTPSP